MESRFSMTGGGYPDGPDSIWNNKLTAPLFYNYDDEMGQAVLDTSYPELRSAVLSQLRPHAPDQVGEGVGGQEKDKDRQCVCDRTLGHGGPRWRFWNVADSSRTIRVNGPSTMSTSTSTGARLSASWGLTGRQDDFVSHGLRTDCSDKGPRALWAART